MLSFQIVVRAKPLECSDLPKLQEKGRQSMFWVFSGFRLGFGRRDLLLFIGVFSRLHGSRQKEPAALEASAKSRGFTPLHVAALKGHAECVDLLLKAGAAKAHPRRSQGGFGRVRGGLSF